MQRNNSQQAKSATKTIVSAQGRGQKTAILRFFVVESAQPSKITLISGRRGSMVAASLRGAGPTRRNYQSGRNEHDDTMRMWQFRGSAWFDNRRACRLAPALWREFDRRRVLGTKVSVLALRASGQHSAHGSAIVNLASVAGLVGSSGQPGLRL
jgi:hypothetical protein